MGATTKKQTKTETRAGSKIDEVVDDVFDSSSEDEVSQYLDDEFGPFGAVGGLGLGEQVSALLTPLFAIGLLAGVASLVGLFALLTIHSATLWLSADPETAFRRARAWAGYLSMGWDSSRELYNGARFLLVAWVPSYNMWTKHFVEPAIFISLDIISLVFARKHYEGVISEDQVPFLGHYCGKMGPGTFDIDDHTRKWCAFDSTAMWAEELKMQQSSDPERTLANRDTLLLSTTHARRLAELTSTDDAEGRSIFPTLHLQPLVDAVGELAGVFSMLESTIYDISAHVIYTVLSELAAELWNLAQIAIRGLVAAIMALVSSGALTTIIRMGIGVLVILVVHVLIPLLLAAVDVFLCIVGFAQPSTWPAQIACIERTCFVEGGNLGAEIWTTFLSVNIVATAVHGAVEALINPRTGRNFGEASTGATDLPEMDAGASATAAGEACAACFSCRVPELRAVWLLLAMTWGCVKDESRYGGRVEGACLDGGSWYLDACGPRGVAYADWRDWGSRFVEHRDYDAGRVEHFAGMFHRLAVDMGGINGVERAEGRHDEQSRELLLHGVRRDAI